MLVKGKLFWAKILGTPKPNKFKNGARQWSFDLSVDREYQEKLLTAGMKKSYLRDKGDERGIFISFVRDELKKDGTPAKPYEVFDGDGVTPWPRSRLLGNGTEANVIVSLSERTFRGEKFLKPSAIKMQIWKLVDFQSKSPFEAGENHVIQVAAPELVTDAGELSTDDLPTDNKEVADW